MRKFKLSYALAMQIIFYLFLFRAVFAFTIGGTEIDPIKIVFGPDVPEEWYDMYLFMQWLVFPFIGIWMVIYGILEELRIFKRKASVQGLLALVMAFIASSSGGIVYGSRILFQAMGVWGISVFFIVFFVGAFLWGYGTIGMRYKAASLWQDYERELKSIDTRITQLKKQQHGEIMKEHPDQGKINAIGEEIRRREMSRRELQEAYERAEK